MINKMPKIIIGPKNNIQNLLIKNYKKLLKIIKIKRFLKKLLIKCLKFKY